MSKAREGRMLQQRAAVCPLQSHSWVSVPSVGSGEVRGTRLEAVPAIGVRSHLVLLNGSCCPES